MLYISKKVCDNLPIDIISKLSQLSVEKQTMFECFYHRFSDETLVNKAVPYAIVEAVEECAFLDKD